MQDLELAGIAGAGPRRMPQGDAAEHRVRAKAVGRSYQLTVT